MYALFCIQPSPKQGTMCVRERERERNRWTDTDRQTETQRERKRKTVREDKILFYEGNRYACMCFYSFVPSSQLRLFLQKLKFEAKSTFLAYSMFLEFLVLCIYI